MNYVIGFSLNVFLRYLKSMLRLFSVDSVLRIIVHYRHGEGGGSGGRAGPGGLLLTELRGGVCKVYGPRRGMRCAGRTSESLAFIHLS